MFSYLEEILLSFAQVMPLPAFAFVSSFVEELVAPIPSGPVMLVMGSLAQLQGYTLLALAGLTVAAAIGKLLGATVVYGIADKAEDVLSGRFAKFFGVTHAQIESFGAKLGNGWKDYVLLTVLRTLPFIPSVVISAGSGVLKIPLRLFIVSTLIGSLLRDAFFLYVGYIGLAGAEELFSGFEHAETAIEILVVIGVLALMGFGFYYRQKRLKRRNAAK